MVCYLAWFATVTHLSGLSIMSKHLHGRPLERILRIILMGILLIVLVVAMVPMAAITIVPSGEDFSALTWNCDASCFFRPQFINLNFVFIGSGWLDVDITLQTVSQFGLSIFAIAMMCFSFVVRLGRVTPILLSSIASKRAAMSTSLQRALIKKADKRFPRAWQNVLWRELLVRPLLCVFLLLRACLLLWSSMMFEVSMTAMDQSP